MSIVSPILHTPMALASIIVGLLSIAGVVIGLSAKKADTGAIRTAAEAFAEELADSAARLAACNHACAHERLGRLTASRALAKCRRAVAAAALKPEP